ncbi:endoglucanase [Clostridium algifaecis]|uniref:Endoglucanase n=1 Tax=Clostridium algifaecis TaxID=1472040 RepID=A0ABS4KZB1_9CLOT|nr:M42 family peptidase [Clostridium algifaecis]MBP2034179.1 endoglucanase [Clostridium algifaecis]
MLLEKLCNSSAPSGYEGDTRNLIKDELKKMDIDFCIDKMGNVLAKKENNQTLKIMIAAHMDEVGLIITSYNSDGTLKFSVLGNIDKSSLPCKVVLIGKNKIKGVIGLKPIHLQSKEDRNRSVSLDDLCIDIGAESEKQARKVVDLGDFVVFNIAFEKFSDNMVKSKALNDRIGCAVLLEILKENYDCDLYVSFNVQENIGERGAFGSVYNVKPDIFILVDTICSDNLIDMNYASDCLEIEKGIIIPFKAGISIFDRETVKYIRNVAEKENIQYQKIAGTKCDGQSIAAEVTGQGTKAAAVLIPCRYMNSAVSMCNLDDYYNVIKLLRKYLESF